jgi:hypothetical protein
MKISKITFVAAAAALVASGVVLAQYPILDTVAGKTIAKYQSATC